MNYIDLLLLLVVFMAIWSCILRGFILSAAELLSWMGSLILAFLSNKSLTAFLEKIFPAVGVWSAPLSFLVSAIVVKLVLDQILDTIILLLPQGVHRHMLNKVLGVVPGAINGLLWATFLSAFLLLLPVGNGIADSVQESRLSPPLLSEATWAGRQFSAVFAEALNHSLRSRSVKVGEEEAVKLPFTVRKPQVRADLEQRMLALVNMERKRSGLKILAADPEMTAVARKHSVDMFGRGYFSHITPDGLSPFDRMERQGVGYLTAGENLALAQTLTLAHDGLMKSPGHRANILNPAFGRLGIGILDGGIYGLMVTQNFRN
jgi:uncharacterized protein YkwD